MKKLLLVLSVTLLITGFYSCTKVDNSNTALCSNGIKDVNESEIDCGGDCTACPDLGTMTCDLGTTSYIASTTLGQILGPNIRVYGNDYRNNQTRPLMFMFVPVALNQALPINAVSFAYNGEAYIMEAGDSGRVTITALDTVRKIVSGTFWFHGNRTTGPDTTSARNGIFTNIRYGH